MAAAVPYPEEVPDEIVEIGWNDEFILAKQHPRDYPEPATTNVTNWYVIDVVNGRVYGPLSYEKFLDTKLKLSVPSTIQLSETTLA